MNKKILVPLTHDERAEEVLPYVERLARPGMSVVFLMCYPVDGIKWQAKEPDTGTDSEVKELLDHYSWEANVSRANTEIAPAVRASRGKGVEVSVEVYAGSLKRAIREHAINDDAGFFNGGSSLFDLFKRPARTPVLLIHPGMTA